MKTTFTHFIEITCIFQIYHQFVGSILQIALTLQRNTFRNFFAHAISMQNYHANRLRGSRESQIHQRVSLQKNIVFLPTPLKSVPSMHSTCDFSSEILQKPLSEIPSKSQPLLSFRIPGAGWTLRATFR